MQANCTRKEIYNKEYKKDYQTKQENNIRESRKDYQINGNKPTTNN